MPTSFIPIFAITRQRTGGLKQRGQLVQITKKRPCAGGAEAVCVGTPAGALGGKVGQSSLGMKTRWPNASVDKRKWNYSFPLHRLRR